VKLGCKGYRERLYSYVVGMALTVWTLVIPTSRFLYLAEPISWREYTEFRRYSLRKINYGRRAWYDEHSAVQFLQNC